MTGQTRMLPIVRVRDGRAEKLRDVVVRESPVTVFLNDVDLVTLMCSPKDLDCLAVGFLFAEGFIKSKNEIKSVFADVKDGGVWVETTRKRELTGNILARRFITTGCGRGYSFVDAAKDKAGLRSRSRLRVPASALLALMREFQRRSEVYRLTGGVHSAALCDEEAILVLKEDIGRHSALDKVVGECVLKGVSTADRIMITSGRVSSEMLVKVARSKVPVIVSKSAPTDLGAKLAKDLGITLVGFARGSRMNIYSHAERIVP